METPKRLALEYCDKTKIGMLDRLVVSLDEIRIGAFLSGYQAAAPQWISVKDRLPKLGTVVLVAKDIGSVNTTYFGVNGFRDEQVTHWMPLPEPPKEGE
jgi:hypothetical protein